MVQPIPAGYHSVTPYLMIRGAARAIDFYRNAFGASEVMRFNEPNGRIGHAEIRIGDSYVMLADENDTYRSPQSLGGAGISLLLYVEDVDKTFAQAVAAGATVQRTVADQFYGDRMGTVVDPFGHVWSIGTHKEDLSMEEVQQRMAKLGEKGGA
ncbi:MAG TPA: VOC family protein [Casimicrobiaceae bacterium]|nr:VOC family protein [Casimicrobiaceae bacterium]